jgi:hypothetical protein
VDLDVRGDRSVDRGCCVNAGVIATKGHPVPVAAGAITRLSFCLDPNRYAGSGVRRNDIYALLRSTAALVDAVIVLREVIAHGSNNIVFSQHSGFER